MRCVNPTEISGFSSFRFGHGRDERTVYERGPDDRPGVILLHELPGMVSQCVRLACELSDPHEGHAGYRVFMPLLFGEPCQPERRLSMAVAAWCVRREFRLLSASKKSPITSWVADLAVDAAGRTGRDRVAVIGMCLTGSLVFGLVAEPVVGAVVASQPSLPAPLLSKQKRSIGVPLEELTASAHTAAPALAMRYNGDSRCPRERFESLAGAYGQALPEFERGEMLDEQLGNLRVVEVPGCEHALLTLHRSEYAVDAVKKFLASNLGTD